MKLADIPNLMNAVEVSELKAMPELIWCCRRIRGGDRKPATLVGEEEGRIKVMRGYGAAREKGRSISDQKWIGSRNMPFSAFKLTVKSSLMLLACPVVLSKNFSDFNGEFIKTDELLAGFWS